MSATEQDDPLSARNQLKQCRICLDNDDAHDIISPCFCSGGSAYVHRKCLNKWRSENASGRAFKYCEICQFEYKIKTLVNDPEADRKRLIKYYLFVIRDLTLIIMLTQLITIGLAFLLKTNDKKGENIKHLFPDSMNGYVTYYFSAFILLMDILGTVALLFLCHAIGNSDGTNTNQRRDTGSSHSSGNRRNTNECLIVMVTMILICAVIGILVGIILSIIILRKIMQHHTSKLWLRQEAEKYIMEDFTGRRKELLG